MVKFLKVREGDRAVLFSCGLKQRNLCSTNLLLEAQYRFVLLKVIAI